ncbi:hypothetical protein OUZ56_011407 [Daphnia magna]|uniref:Uncharacterized protein n=1 Tax=Daphnia magna TaxID=35525 RepID=A0ABQ9Z087_9CRUS|nr:hypothetical protein OUZ56_011407 [Daphnia magna]
MTYISEPTASRYGTADIAEASSSFLGCIQVVRRAFGSNGIGFGLHLGETGVCRDTRQRGTIHTIYFGMKFG